MSRNRAFNLETLNAFKASFLFFCGRKLLLSHRTASRLMAPVLEGWKTLLQLGKEHAIFPTFILKYNETQGKVDPGVIILYNIPDDSRPKSNFGS